MSQWTDKHYNFTYKLTQKDVEAGEIKVDPYFVGMVWKTGSRDDSGALAHCLKTIARFGDKNTVEREIKALYAQVKGLARVHGVKLEGEHQTSNTSQCTGMVVQGSSIKPATSSPWYPDDSGEWVEYYGSGQPVDDDVVVAVLLRAERDEQYWGTMPFRASEWNWDISVGSTKIVAYKIVK